MKSKNMRFLTAALMWAILVFLDQYTKYLAAVFLKPVGAVTLIPNTLQLRYLENRGAAFGILQNRQWLFIIFAFACIIVCAVLCFRLAAMDRHAASRVCLAALAAGAAGNLIDRISHGYVIDFIYVSLIHFPIFNLADVYVSLSTIALVLLVLFYYKDEF